MEPHALCHQRPSARAVETYWHLHAAHPSGNGVTNHGSIVQYKGQWFAFYHNSALSGDPWLRSVCVDRLYHNADGTIRMVEQR